MRESKKVLLLLAACFVVTPLLFAGFDSADEDGSYLYSYGNIDIRFEYGVGVPSDIFVRSVKRIAADNGFTRGGANGQIGACTVIVSAAPPNVKATPVESGTSNLSWFSYSCQSFGKEQGYPEILVSGSTMMGKEFSASFARFSHEAGIATKRIR